MDWDMRIKQIMVGVGQGTKAVADWPFDHDGPPQPSETPRHTRDMSIPRPSPYGNKWDLIWLGHCGSAANGDGRIFAFNDTSAPDKEHAWVYGPHPTDDQREPGTRIVYHLKETVCTTAYAISNSGARKMERAFKEANAPVDTKMWDTCAHDHHLSCLGVFPQVISPAESRTNINHDEGGFVFGHEITEERLVAGKGIQVSSRVNADLGLADKGPEGWKWEWEDEGKKVETEGKERDT